jgi:CHASE2 domain-containing sensor protein
VKICRRWRKRRPEAPDLSPFLKDCPFPGLAPYTGDDAPYFKGREIEAEVLLDNVLAYDLCVLYGPSGAGKSSVVRAGLAPSLQRERSLAAAASPANVAEGGLVPVIFDAWDESPGANLRAHLASLLPTSSKPDGHTQTGLADVIKALEKKGDRPLIVLDQFESYFTTEGETDLDLVGLIEAAGDSASFLLVLREDSLALLNRFGDMIHGLFDNLIRIDHLDAEHAARAIEETVAAFNASRRQHAPMVLEPGLAGTVVAASQEHGEGTPVKSTYTQLLMRRLWGETRRAGSHELRALPLKDLGGSERIVAEHVESNLSVLGDREQALAAGVFRSLIAPSRAPMALTAVDIAALGGFEPDEISRVLERLVNKSRLLQPAGHDRYEIAYDALADPIAAWRDRRAALERKRRERWQLGVVACTTVALLVVVLAGLHSSLEQLELGTVNARFHIRGNRQPPNNLVVVKIDRRSTGNRGTLRRELAGNAIDAMVEDKPAVIAFDEDFQSNEHTRNGERETRSLLESIAGAEGKVVLAATALSERPRGSRTNILGGEQAEQNLAEVGARVGYSKYEPDIDGAIRRPLYARRGVKSFAVVTAEEREHHPVASSALDGTFIDYYGKTFPSVTLTQLEHHEIASARLRGKIVLAGITDPASGDLHRTSEGDGFMTGVEIQANAIETVLEGAPLKAAPTWLNVLLALLLGAAPLALSLRYRMRVVVPVSLAMLGVWAVATQLGFDQGVVLNAAYPAAALLGSLLLLAVIRVSVAGPPQRRTRSATD